MESSLELVGPFSPPDGRSSHAGMLKERAKMLTSEFFSTLEKSTTFDSAIVVIPGLLTLGSGVFSCHKMPPSETCLLSMSRAFREYLDRLHVSPRVEMDHLLREIRLQVTECPDKIAVDLSRCLQPIAGTEGVVGLVGLFRLSGAEFNEVERIGFAAEVGKLSVRLGLDQLGDPSKDELERAEEELHRLRVLEAISTEITSTLDPKKVAELLSGRALELIPHLDLGSVWVLDQKAGKLDLLAEKGYPAGFFSRKSTVNLDEDFAVAKVAVEGKSDFRVDLNENTNTEQGRLVAIKTGLLSWACLPLICNRGILGSLFVASYKPREWDQLEQKFLEAVASLVAHALENSLLYQEAEAQRRWLQLIIDQMPESVVIAEAADASIAMANRAADEMMGTPMLIGFHMLKRRGIELFRRPNGEVYPTAEMPLMRSLLTGETCLGVEVVVRRPDGNEITFLTNSSALRDADGKILGSVVVSSDITKIKEVEKLKDQFLAVASHELRTPLTSIRGFTQSMMKRVEKRIRNYGEEISPHGELELKQMGIILSQVDKITALIDEMLDVSRLQQDVFAITYSPVDFPMLVRSVVDNLQIMTGKHNLIVDIPEDLLGGSDGCPSGLCGDVRLLESVMTNLVQNAIKFSPHGGEIVISVIEENEKVKVVVSDPGIGILRHQIEEIFKPFSQGSNVPIRQYGGLGLGLYLCKEIIERHGGRIWAEHRESGGSNLCFVLPLAHRSELSYS